MRIPFTKMQGAGNDYVYVWCPDGKIPGGDDVSPAELAVAVSDRHFGVGSDGLVLILPGSEGCDFTMRMFNNDGSEAQMCGNATRCIGRYVREHGLLKSGTQRAASDCVDIVTLATRAGRKEIRIVGDPVEYIEVDMGVPDFDPAKVPAADAEHRGGHSVVTLEADGKKFEAVCVSMGNPHGVIFLPPETERITDDYVLGLGPVFEKDGCWPEKANIEFIISRSDHELDMRVWERGTGETLACGTGACASFAAARALGLIGDFAEIRLPGGTLSIRRDSRGHLLMRGPAETICEGEYRYRDAARCVCKNRVATGCGPIIR